ncbi:MAG: dihydroorotate dehydrogenase electron transfer subunit [Fermentimonas sp.]|jgi:dihydroorotate dehydrogenase electron transfer subunit
MEVLDFIVKSNESLNYRNVLLKVTPADGKPLAEMFPGQFVQILVEDSKEVFLRRPISVNFVDEKRNELWLLVQNVGNGTDKISQLKDNDVVNIIYPLGKSFTINNDVDNVVLIGGGVGTAPLLFLGDKLNKAGVSCDFILGGASQEDVLQIEQFEKLGDVFITTEDGKLGEKGYVTNHSILSTKKYDYIYTCGPKPMMVAVAKYAKDNSIECEASLENLMACGFGACLCCIEKTKHGNLCTCTEGPVFNTKELTWLD